MYEESAQPKNRTEGNVQLPRALIGVIAVFVLAAAHAIYNAATAEGTLFWVAVTGLLAAIAYGLSRGSQVAWSWARWTTQVLAMVAAVPLLLGVGGLVAMLFRVEFAREAGTVFSIALAGAIFATPFALAFLVAYRILGKKPVRVYCAVCPHMDVRFARWRLKLMFTRAECPQCAQQARHLRPSPSTIGD